MHLSLRGRSTVWRRPKHGRCTRSMCTQSTTALLNPVLAAGGGGCLVAAPPTSSQQRCALQRCCQPASAGPVLAPCWPSPGCRHSSATTPALRCLVAVNGSMAGCGSMGGCAPGRCVRQQGAVLPACSLRPGAGWTAVSCCIALSAPCPWHDASKADAGCKGSPPRHGVAAEGTTPGGASVARCSCSCDTQGSRLTIMGLSPAS